MKTQTKTASIALAALVALAPSLALGFGIDFRPDIPVMTDPSGGSSSGGVYSPALSDAVSNPSGGGIHSPSLNDAVNNPSGGGIYSPALNGAVNNSGGVITPVKPLPIKGFPGSKGAGTGVASGDPTVKIAVALECFASGTPSAFPDDLRVRNAGAAPVPAGTELQWMVKATGDAGYAVLARTLRPGQLLRLNDVLENGVEVGTICAAWII